MKQKSLTIALIVAGICMLSVAGASAQDVILVNYFANNGVSGAPDATVRVTNTGFEHNNNFSGNICAMVYVFDNDQQMNECCGCLLTPDGLRTFSVTKDLTSNPLVPSIVNHGAIEIIPADPNGSAPCDPTAGMDPSKAMSAWATHIENKVGNAYPITETEFTISLLNEVQGGTLVRLEDDCYFVHRLGSGRGVCSCGTGD